MPRLPLHRTLAAGLLIAVATACTPEIASNTINWAEKRTRLQNGLRVVIMPDDTTQLVQLAVRYEVGSNEDPPGKAGLAHLVEHMMFQHHPLGPDKPATFDLIPQISVGFNANTSYDRTHYFELLRKEDFENALAIEAFRMAKGCETIPPEQFDREREVVRNEIRGHFATAEGLIGPMLGADVYPAGHPYSHDTGGNDQQLTNITLQDACDFMKKYYVPERAMVIVAGNVDPVAAGKLINLHFGGIEKRAPAPRAEVAPIELSYKRIDHELDIEKPVVIVTFKAPPQSSDDWRKIQALSLFIGKLASQAHDYEFAESIQPDIIGGNWAPALSIVMTLHSNDDIDQALDWVWKAKEHASDNLDLLSFDEDTKAKAKMGLVVELESLDARTGFIADLMQYKKHAADFDGNDTWLFDELDKIDRITADGYKSFVEKTLDRNHAIVSVFKAKPTGAKGDKRANLSFDKQTSDAGVVPLVDPAEAAKQLPAPTTGSLMAKAERYTLGNGMKVILLPYKSLPIVQAWLVFRNAGTAVEEAPGLADVAASYLGVEDSNAESTFGFSVGGFASEDASTFRVSTMSSYVNDAIKALERQIKAGTYNQESLESYQKNVKLGFDSKEYREQLAYQTAVAAALYGPDHPYTKKGTPLPESVGKIGYDAAMAFKEKHFTAKNGTLIIVGGFDPKSVKGTISDTFGDWSGGHKDDAVKPTQRQRTGAEFIGVIQEKEAPQTTVTIAYPAPAGIDGQQAARQILAAMLNLRMELVRTKLGSTYGTYAGKQSHAGPGAYIMGGSIDSPRTGESLKMMRDLVDGLRKGDADFDKDFVAARRTVYKNLLAQSSVSGEIANRLATMAAYDLKPDYYDQLLKFVAACSEIQVKMLIQSELKPENEIVVLKADRANLEKAFAGAGITSVRYDEPK